MFQIKRLKPLVETGLYYKLEYYNLLVTITSARDLFVFTFIFVACR